MKLSIIAPLYNEEDSVKALYESITGAVKPLGYDYEILFVDDGSKDNTFEIAKSLSQQDEHLIIIKFRRNYGQTPAMVAGIDNASGDVLITMDGDLQNDPRDIAELLTKINEGYDIVVGWRHKRKDKLITRKIPSKIANWLIGKVTGVPIKDNGCSLKCYRANIIKNVPLYSEMHRFIPAMASITGAKIAEIKVRHHERQFGESKYGLSRIYKVLLDLLTIKTITTFASRPLLWFSILAIPPFIVSVVAFGISVWNLYSGSNDMLLSLAGTGLLFAGLVIILLMSGVVCELIYKTGNLKHKSLAFLTTNITNSKN
ncbi:MAG: glycosyltransferase family 2 protein [Gammaproteobacteria bacterium]|nr:glycosyltransferase family 2 protein [Gammaproteobacteria bacterium]